MSLANAMAKEIAMNGYYWSFVGGAGVVSVHV
jgi:hypothetical protein